MASAPKRQSSQSVQHNRHILCICCLNMDTKKNSLQLDRFLANIHRDHQTFPTVLSPFLRRTGDAELRGLLLQFLSAPSSGILQTRLQYCRTSTDNTRVSLQSYLSSARMRSFRASFLSNLIAFSMNGRQISQRPFSVFT